MDEPEIDPTQNVLDWVRAAIERQDDLRGAEAQHLREIMAVRADLGEKLRNAESRRLDANRATDIGVVERAIETSATQALALANQVEATRIAAATSLAAALDPITKSISDLQRAQYETQGQKSAVVEQRSSNSDTRTWLIGVFGILATTAVLVAPHIH